MTDDWDLQQTSRKLIGPSPTHQLALTAYIESTETQRVHLSSEMYGKLDVMG